LRSGGPRRLLHRGAPVRVQQARRAFPFVMFA
jgi:hypothetical protein